MNSTIKSIVLGLVLVHLSGAAKATEPTVVYAFAAPKGRYLHLFQIVDGKIVTQQPLGYAVIYGLSSSRLVAYSGKVRVFNSTTGELLKEHVAFIEGLWSPGTGRTTKGITIDANGEYAFFASIYQGTAQDWQLRPNTKRQVIALNLNTGEIQKYPVPEIDQPPDRTRLPAAPSSFSEGFIYVLKDSSLIKFSFATRLFSPFAPGLKLSAQPRGEPYTLEYAPAYGLICKKSYSGEVSRIGDKDLQPTTQPSVSVVPEPVRFMTFLPQTPFVFYSDNPTNGRPKGRDVKLVMFDITLQRKLWEKTKWRESQSIYCGRFRVSPDGTRIVTGFSTLQMYNRLEERTEWTAKLPLESPTEVVTFDVVWPAGSV